MSDDSAPRLDQFCDELICKLVQNYDLQSDQYKEGWHLWVLGDDKENIIRAENTEHQTIIILHKAHGTITVAATDPSSKDVVTVMRDSKVDLALENHHWLTGQLQEVQRTFLGE